MMSFSDVRFTCPFVDPPPQVECSKDQTENPKAGLTPGADNGVTCCGDTSSVQAGASGAWALSWRVCKLGQQECRSDWPGFLI